MTYLARPKIELPGQKTNAIGLTLRDYEGALSTLCAGCGHDSITAALVQALWEMSLRPEMLIKLSGIGCSSKTPAYFVHGAHGFNSVHGRMPSVATGALAANRDLIGIGVSGDGDSLSIGFGQFGHVIRRNVNMLYLIENNGVYGLTKGQYSPTSEFGKRTKSTPEGTVDQPIVPPAVAVAAEATFVARTIDTETRHLRATLLRSASLLS